MFYCLACQTVQLRCTSFSSAIIIIIIITVKHHIIILKKTYRCWYSPQLSHSFILSHFLNFQYCFSCVLTTIFSIKIGWIGLTGVAKMFSTRRLSLTRFWIVLVWYVIMKCRTYLYTVKTEDNCFAHQSHDNLTTCSGLWERRNISVEQNCRRSGPGADSSVARCHLAGGGGWHVGLR